MLTLHGKPLFPTEGPRVQRPGLSRLEATMMILSLSILGWLCIGLAVQALLG